jgi:histidyl-tRNA synthetase
LLAAFGLNAEAIEELQAILRIAEAHGVDSARMTLDFGLGRGLSYYTGMIFEIYTYDEQLQLCGGGRYDDLVTALGGRQPVPASGFSYGLERVVAAAAMVAEQSIAGVVVAATDEASYPYALRAAARLRELGWQVHVDVRARNAAANLRDAERRGVIALVNVGIDQQQHETVLWRNLPGREEQYIALADLPKVPKHG